MGARFSSPFQLPAGFVQVRVSAVCPSGPWNDFPAVGVSLQERISMKVYGISGPAPFVAAPPKLLLRDTGKPLLQYARGGRHEGFRTVGGHHRRGRRGDCLRRPGFGARVEMTGEHPSGSDRIAEVVRRCCPDADAVVNIQGTRPELDPGTLDRLVAAPGVAAAGRNGDPGDADPRPCDAPRHELRQGGLRRRRPGPVFLPVDNSFYRDGRPEDLLPGPEESDASGEQRPERGSLRPGCSIWECTPIAGSSCSR